MSHAATPGSPDIAAGRLDAATLAKAFGDLHPPLNAHEASVEADRCYFCFDAPCQIACPTSIDIPMFIREIAAGNVLGAAETILNANIMGGTCARVCPTETLCEEACVREAAEGKPVKIGHLQRFAVDALMAKGEHPFTRKAPTGKRVAIVGAGPAGLACAHALAREGHEAIVFEAREKAGGLNEYGVAAYKVANDFAAREVEFILALGGISIVHGRALGENLNFDDLRRDYDAVFLAIGLPSTNALGLEDEDRLSNVREAVEAIAELRQAKDLTQLPVGRRVVVIGGGMTAVDIAVQTKRLGAESVTMVYRRGVEQMKASGYERDLAQTNGVLVVPWARPIALEGLNGSLAGVTFVRTRETDGRLVDTHETFTLPVDVAFSAIGQKGAPEIFAGSEAPALKDGRIVVDAERRTSLPGVWAGGDCVAGGKDLTVAAVEDGKRAAQSINAALTRAMRA